MSWPNDRDSHALAFAGIAVREHPELISDEIEAERERRSHQSGKGRPCLGMYPPARMHVGRNVRGGSHIDDRPQQADKQKLSTLHDMVLVGGPPKSPGAIHQVTVQHRTDEGYCLKDREHRTCLSRVGEEDEDIQNREIDNRIDDPDHSEAKDLYDVRFSPWGKWSRRIHQGDSAIRGTIHLVTLGLPVFMTYIPLILVNSLIVPSAAELLQFVVAGIQVRAV